MNHAVPTANGGVDYRLTAAIVALAGLLGMAAVTAATNRVAGLVVVGGLGGIALLMAVVVLTRGRLSDVLVLGAVAAMAIPIDKFFAVQDHVGGWPGFRLSLSDLALAMLVPLLLLGAWVGRIHNRVPRAVLVVYALLLMQYLVSVLDGARRDLGMFEIASAVHALLVSVIVAAAVRRDLLRPIIALIALQVVVHTVFAAAQAATGRPIGAQWFAGTSIVQEMLQTGEVRLRPSGLFDHPIVYANMIMLSVPMLAAALFVRGGALWRASMFVALLVALTGLGLTLARGAWIGTACAVLVFVALARWYRLLSARRVAALAVGAVVTAVVLGPPLATRFYERLVASNESNLSVRFELNWIAASMIQANPLTGVGLNNFIPVMEQYDPTNVMRRFPATVHNVYLLEAAEAGIAALVLFVALFGTIVWTGLARVATTPDDAARWVMLAIVAGLLGFLVTQLADFSHRLEPLRSVIWMNIGLLFALHGAREPHVRTEGRQ